MSAPASFTAIDAELRLLAEEADFAEARYGTPYAAGLRHARGALASAMLVAFERTTQARDLTMSRRDRIACERHAHAIAAAVEADLIDVRTRFVKIVQQATPSGPGAKAALGAALSYGKVIVDTWWEGHVRLGPLTAPGVAAQDWHTLRPMPRWLPWTIGAVGVTSAATPALVLLLL